MCFSKVKFCFNIKYDVFEILKLYIHFKHYLYLNKQYSVGISIYIKDISELLEILLSSKTSISFSILPYIKVFSYSSLRLMMLSIYSLRLISYSFQILCAFYSQKYKRLQLLVSKYTLSISSEKTVTLTKEPITIFRKHNGLVFCLANIFNLRK